MKKVLFLGGNHVQMTAIRAAIEDGYYVITADYLPDNPGHKIAHEYHNISTVDAESILCLAKNKQIDGIVSYASDVSAPTAAYVAEKMNLPTNPYDSVNILTHKNLFRAFLKNNGFPVPNGCGFTSKDSAREYINNLKFPIMVKPVDSSGSKGVSFITKSEDFDKAWELALSFSRTKTIIVEEFIRKVGYQADGDIFVSNGEIVFWGVCDQHHDNVCSPFIPVGLSFPSTQSKDHQAKAREQIQRLLRLLDMRMGAYNVEYIVGQDGQIYILEIGPRNGGNFIPDALRVATGVDLALCTVRQAVGDEYTSLLSQTKNQCCSSYVVHSQCDGYFDDVVISEKIADKLVEKRMFINKGDFIHRFVNGGCGIGAMLFVFQTEEEMCKTIDRMNDNLKVITNNEAIHVLHN